MRNLFVAFASAAVMTAAVPALAATSQDAAAPAAVAAPSGDVSDADLAAFNTAMDKVKTINAAVQGGTPSAEQQAEMAAAIQASGLDIEKFNAISTQVSSDDLLRARLAVLQAPAPAAGSVAASVSDDEVAKFAAAMVKLRDLAPAAGQTPSAEQQAAMASTVQESGLAVDRFNAISTAVSQDAQLRARVELADARRDG